MAEPIPTTQFGLLSTRDSITLTELPVPQPRQDEVLIQNVAVASNPKDWMLPKNFEFYKIHRNEGEGVSVYNAVEGNDVSGKIVKVGPGVTEYRSGERVAALTKMMQLDARSGAYMQYSIAPASTTFPIPESVPFEDAATLPLAVMTSAIGLFKRLALPESSTGDERGIIINGASTSVGAFAVQLAKRAGLFVVGIAGSSKDYAKNMGADVVIDYREQKGDNIIRAIVESSQGRAIAHAYNAVIDPGSTVRLAKALKQTSPDGKGIITFMELFVSDEEAKHIPEGIETVRTSVDTAYGEDEKFAARWYRKIGRWLEASESNHIPFKPNKTRIMPNGLASVAEGLALLESKQIHGEKLVYRIAETPPLNK